jgi:hypothetical protein
MPKLYDKHGYPFRHGDVVKVFHFVGSSKKRYYMYKQVGYTKLLNGSPFLRFNHLTGKGFYYMLADERVIDGYEIVQGRCDDYEQRSRRNIKECVPVQQATAKGMQAQKDAPATV